jgi:hypothetical protein
VAGDIVIPTINIAVVAAMRAEFIVAVRTQEVELLPEAAPLPEAEAHMSPTAVAHAAVSE